MLCFAHLCCQTSMRPIIVPCHTVWGHHGWNSSPVWSHCNTSLQIIRIKFKTWESVDAYTRIRRSKWNKLIINMGVWTRDYWSNESVGHLNIKQEVSFKTGFFLIRHAMNHQTCPSPLLKVVWIRLRVQNFNVHSNQTLPKCEKWGS